MPQDPCIHTIITHKEELQHFYNYCPLNQEVYKSHDCENRHHFFVQYAKWHNQQCSSSPCSFLGNYQHQNSWCYSLPKHISYSAHQTFFAKKLWSFVQNSLKSSAIFSFLDISMVIAMTPKIGAKIMFLSSLVP